MTEHLDALDRGQIVESMGGTIGLAESRIGGAAFRITVPQRNRPRQAVNG